MTTDSFSAERLPNGDVGISHRGMVWTDTKGGCPLPIRIPKEHCTELAKLLWPDMFEGLDWTPPPPKSKHTGAVPSTDYARGSDEPE